MRGRTLTPSSCGAAQTGSARDGWVVELLPAAEIRISVPQLLSSLLPVEKLHWKLYDM